MRRFVLDSNCYIDAARSPEAFAPLRQFASWAAPQLYLSSVVAAELRAGVRTARERQELERSVLGPLVRRGRVVTPSAAAWDALGLTLAELRARDGLVLTEVGRSFALDILLAFSCREIGATLVTSNARDMRRIRRVFTFEFVAPYPPEPKPK